MEIGKKIKELRTAKGLTQEALAAELSVSPQAISKWETGLTLPDVQLLPQIAIYFGVTLDELFCLTDDNEIDRIQNMIWDCWMLPQGELERAERFLLAKIAADYRAGTCYCLLAQLHNHQAQQHHELAAAYAKQALERDPNVKDGHSELVEAMGGVMPDWCVRNRHKLIDYYKAFLTAHPESRNGYLWLLDNLIADNRLAEAEEYLAKLARVDDSWCVPVYRGQILRAAGKLSEAEACWRDVEQKYPDEWCVSLSLGDFAADAQDYDAAIAYYRKALAQQKAPRYVDGYESIAQIYEICGNYTAAIETYEEELAVFRTEWDSSEGETVDCVRREIARLKRARDGKAAN